MYDYQYVNEDSVFIVLFCENCKSKWTMTKYDLITRKEKHFKRFDTLEQVKEYMRKKQC